jgi:uncharacterized protein (DUF1684 family)
LTSPLVMENCDGHFALRVSPLRNKKRAAFEPARFALALLNQ